jgi:hypothetical protein
MDSLGRTPAPHLGPEFFLQMTFKNEDLELLRDVLVQLKKKNNFSWAQIEDAAETPKRRIERFVRLKRRPVNNDDLLRMAKWVASMLQDRGTLLTRAIKETVPINYKDAMRVWTAYSGEWFCISEAETAGHVYGMRLRIFAPPAKHNEDGFPLPKFTIELGSDDVTDDGETPMPHPVDGYIQLRDDDLYLIGQSMWEPRGRFGLMTFEDKLDRPVREVMSGWGILPTLNRSPPRPRKLVAGRFSAGDGSVPIGNISDTETIQLVPNFAALVQRLRIR